MDAHLKVLGVLLCCLLSLGAVYASYTIYSNIVTVNVGGTLVLSFSQTPQGTVDLSATLTRNSLPLSDVSVSFFNVTGGLHVSLGSSMTSLSGVATLQLTGVSDGTKQYQAECVQG